jgi:hypothetical protein
MQKNYKPGLISILVPTRNRPSNVIRLINSATLMADNANDIEFIFYVDFDDASFPSEVISEKCKIIYGPKIWLSLMLNILYANANGEILMYAGDDIEFCTSKWDLKVKYEFEKIQDKIILVYGSDAGSYGGKIAIHGFLHRKWIEAVGAFAPPFRLSLTDLWHTENAIKIARLVYLPDVVIKHIHYRQGNKEATFDGTYKNVYSQSKAWRPMLTYKKLERERRIDRILLIEAMSAKPKIEPKYFLSELIAKTKLTRYLENSEVRRLKSSSNLSVILIIINRIIRKTSFKAS